MAYAWAGRCAAPTADAMAAGVAAYRAKRGGPQVIRMHALARLLARAAGVEPDPARWPELSRALLFGVQSPVSFRLEGPDALPDAADRVRHEAGVFGTLAHLDLTDEEKIHLRTLAAARGDDAFSAFVAGLG